MSEIQKDQMNYYISLALKGVFAVCAWLSVSLIRDIKDNIVKMESNIEIIAKDVIDVKGRVGIIEAHTKEQDRYIDKLEAKIK